MSPDPDQTTEGTPEGVDAKPASGPSVILLVLFAALGAGAGGWLGGPIVGPQIQQLVASSGSDDGGYGGGGGGHGSSGGGETEEPIAIDNLILNPANSNGSRFLIATLVLDADESARGELEARDAEARDLLLSVLATRTVEELSDISLREEIREDLRAVLNAMLGRDAVHRIFFPQFVIQ